MYIATYYIIIKYIYYMLYCSLMPVLLLCLLLAYIYIVLIYDPDSSTK